MRWFELLTEELWLPLWHHFLFTCMHAHKSLGNEMSLLRKIAELEIQLVCLEWAWSGELFFSQYCIGRLWRQMCCSVIDGKFTLKHVAAAIKRVQPHPPTYISFYICRLELCTELFYAIIPTLFLCFLLICYAYISLHFLMFFFILVNILSIKSLSHSWFCLAS